MRWMRGPRNAYTNWRSHRSQAGRHGRVRTGDAGLIARARPAFRWQVGANIQADGSVFDFHERDALHYVTYDLDPLLMAALAAGHAGEDWYGWKSPSGSSLAGACLAGTLCGGRRRRPIVEFVHSLDPVRSGPGGGGTGGICATRPWDPGNAREHPYARSPGWWPPAIGAFATKLAERTGRQPLGLDLAARPLERHWTRGSLRCWLSARKCQSSPPS